MKGILHASSCERQVFSVFSPLFSKRYLAHRVWAPFSNGVTTCKKDLRLPDESRDQELTAKLLLNTTSHIAAGPCFP